MSLNLVPPQNCRVRFTSRYAGSWELDPPVAIRAQEGRLFYLQCLTQTKCGISGAEGPAFPSALATTSRIGEHKKEYLIWRKIGSEPRRDGLKAEKFNLLLLRGLPEVDIEVRGVSPTGARPPVSPSARGRNKLLFPHRHC